MVGRENRGRTWGSSCREEVPPPGNGARPTSRTDSDMEDGLLSADQQQSYKLHLLLLLNYYRYELQPAGGLDDDDTDEGVGTLPYPAMSTRRELALELREMLRECTTAFEALPKITGGKLTPAAECRRALQHLCSAPSDRPNAFPHGVISFGQVQLCPGTRFEQCPGNRKRLLPSRFLSLAGSCWARYPPVLCGARGARSRGSEQSAVVLQLPRCLATSATAAALGVRRQLRALRPAYGPAQTDRPTSSGRPQLRSRRGGS
jgi:hypothetical protein